MKKHLIWLALTGCMEFEHVDGAAPADTAAIEATDTAPEPIDTAPVVDDTIDNVSVTYLQQTRVGAKQIDGLDPSEQPPARRGSHLVRAVFGSELLDAPLSALCTTYVDFCYQQLPAEGEWLNMSDIVVDRPAHSAEDVGPNVLINAVEAERTMRLSGERFFYGRTFEEAPSGNLRLHATVPGQETISGTLLPDFVAPEPTTMQLSDVRGRRELGAGAQFVKFDWESDGNDIVLVSVDRRNHGFNRLYRVPDTGLYEWPIAQGGGGTSRYFYIDVIRISPEEVSMPDGSTAHVNVVTKDSFEVADKFECATDLKMVASYYGYESGVIIKDAAGTEIWSYDELADYATYEETIDLEPGDYTVTLTDSGGSGWATGYFSISVDDDEVFNETLGYGTWGVYQEEDFAYEHECP